jgi:hypothetical protein
LAFQILFISITKDFSQEFQMQAPIIFVFPKISFPQSAGINWELSQPSQRMPVDQGIQLSEAKPQVFFDTIEDRKDSKLFLEPSLSLESPLPSTPSVQACLWPVDFCSSVGERNRLSSLMDQSGLASPAARNCQGEPSQVQAGGDRGTPAAGYAPCVPYVAPTIRGLTRTNPGSNLARPEQWKAQPTAEFSMSLLRGDPQPLHSFCTCSLSSQTFNFSNIICSFCFPQFKENFTSFENFETGLFQKTSFPSDGSTFPPSFANQKNPTLWEQLGRGPFAYHWRTLLQKPPTQQTLPSAGSRQKGWVRSHGRRGIL